MIKCDRIIRLVLFNVPFPLELFFLISENFSVLRLPSLLYFQLVSVVFWSYDVAWSTGQRTIYRNTTFSLLFVVITRHFLQLIIQQKITG